MYWRAANEFGIVRHNTGLENICPYTLLYTEVKHYIKDLYNREWMSLTSYSSPSVDYRELNQKTDSEGNTWVAFFFLDQGKAYYQGFVHGKSRHFLTWQHLLGLGLYEWKQISFGLSNTPASFQYFMKGCFESIHDEISISYLDNAIIKSKTCGECTYIFEAFAIWGE